jgi:hypothetical protein
MRNYDVIFQLIKLFELENSLAPKQITQSRRPQAIQSENISKLDFKATFPQRLLYTAKHSTSRYLKIKSQ